MSDRDLYALSVDEQARLARVLMRRQGGLSLRVAAVFVVLVLGVPLMNRYFPGLADKKVGRVERRRGRTNDINDRNSKASVRLR